MVLVLDHKTKEVEASSPRSVRLIKSKQILVSFVALMCGLFLLIKNPLVESGAWRPERGVPLVSSDFDNNGFRADSTAVAGVNSSLSASSNNTGVDTQQDSSLSASSTGVATQQDSSLSASSRNTGLATQNSSAASSNSKCNFARGRWIYDPVTRPLYTGEFCNRWLSKGWDCRADKLHNFTHENYRWQPDGCDLPAFDAAKLLHRMRNKTVAFVGDSLGRQQFQSLLCMMINNRTRVVDASSSYEFPLKATSAQRFVDTNTTVLFYWSSTLGEEIPRADGEGSELHVDRVPLFLQREIDRLDVVVVNTGHHWNRGKIKANKWSIHVNGQPKDLKVHVARGMAIGSCARWLDEQVERRGDLQVFIRSLSPRHFVGGEWDSGGRCDNLEPMNEQALTDFKGDIPVENAVRKSRNLKLLDITYLSKLRGEAHIANLLKPAASSSSGRQDCLHWCLPGVPDTWNEILYAFLTVHK